MSLTAVTVYMMRLEQHVVPYRKGIFILGLIATECQKCLTVKSLKSSNTCSQTANKDDCDVGGGQFTTLKSSFLKVS